MNLAGGYTENAFEFGGVLLNKEAFEVSQNAKEKLYEDFISSFIENSFTAGGETFESLNIFISELKNSAVSGRINAEFNLEKLESNPSLNVKLMEGDEIIIPEVVDHIYVFGEIANQGTTSYAANQTLSGYLNNVGGMTDYADGSSIFILHPNGISERVSRKNVFRENREELIIYPGSIIFVPREIPNTFRAEVFQGYASILGNLGVSLASISVLKD